MSDKVNQRSVRLAAIKLAALPKADADWVLENLGDSQLLQNVSASLKDLRQKNLSEACRSMTASLSFESELATVTAAVKPSRVAQVLPEPLASVASSLLDQSNSSDQMPEKLAQVVKEFMDDQRYAS